jgi:hypothetical protein
MTNFSGTKVIILFLILVIGVPSFSQIRNVKKPTLNSLLAHKWAVAIISNEKEMEPSDKKVLPFDASPAELPNTIEFFSDGSLLLDLKKGTWRTTPGKNILRINFDGKPTSYHVKKLQNQKLRLLNLSDQKKTLLLTRLD